MLKSRLLVVACSFALLSLVPVAPTQAATSPVGGETAAAAALPLTGIVALAAGANHTCALTSTGAVRCWGSNGYGQLGDGSMTSRSAPVQVVGLTSGVTAIAAGPRHTCAVTTAGGLKCWGSNAFGELGDGTTILRTTPVDATGFTSGVSAVTAGASHTCALTTAGGVSCWGANNYGQLGDGSLTSGVTAITAGVYFTCALTTTGGVKCWGANYDGQLGDGSTIQRSSPVDVTGLSSGVSAVAAGRDHTCALTGAGGATCWGNNNFGELGDGSAANRSTPVQVVGLTSGVAAIVGGSGHTCARTTPGGVKCWGLNQFGQLGNGTVTGRVTPFDVTGLSSGVAAITAGGFHTCALTGAGGAKCWGSNADGELGDGTTTNRVAPVDVLAGQPPVVRPGTVWVTEGNAGTVNANLPVTLSVASTDTVTVDWTTLVVSGAPAGQADATVDYMPASGSLTFAPGETAKTVSIAVNGDTLAEANEYIVVAFRNLTNATLAVGLAGAGWVGITNDDTPVVQPGVVWVLEGNAGTVNAVLPVTLSLTSALTVTVDWTTRVVSGAPAGQADATVDYVPASGSLTFAPGETAKTVSITVNGDTLVEPNEYIVVAFRSLTNATLAAGLAGVGWVGITNDD